MSQCRPSSGRFSPQADRKTEWRLSRYPKKIYDHKAHILLLYMYLEYHSVCRLCGIGTPHPSPAIECVPPPRNHMQGVYTLAYVLGGGGSQFGRLERKLSILSTLWVRSLRRERGWNNKCKRGWNEHYIGGWKNSEGNGTINTHGKEQ